MNQAMDTFLEYYYPRAQWLQDACNWGDQPYTGQEANEFVNDPLMQHIEIYDCYTRDAAGFSNVLQDLWYGSSTPKWHHMSQNRKDVCIFNEGSNRDLDAWLYMFMVHRLTGSGASFEWDHGYRNSEVQTWGQLETIEEMVQALIDRKASGVPMFTSIGNQPAAPRKGVSNLDFMVSELPLLIRQLAAWMAQKEHDHKEIVDYLNNYNKLQGHRRFNFQYSAFSMDCSDYFPELVNVHSHVYPGNNAVRCAKLLAPGMKYDKLMDYVVGETGGKPKDLEDVLCDSVRFFQNYVPVEQREEFGWVRNNSGFDPGWEQRN